MKLKLLTFILILATSLSARADAPKYIFYFIGDGMGMGHIMSTQTYNREVLKSSNPILMLQFPVASWAMTYSYQNPITDSAAAGTALSCGHKTRNGMLGMKHDSIAVKSIAYHLKQHGYGVAITTSVPPDDATPAAFYAQVPSRKMFYEIGKDMANSGYDFFAGSLLRGLKDKKGKETDLGNILSKNGYTIAYGKKNIPSDAKKVILLNHINKEASQIGYTIDSIPGALTLPEITAAALDHMKKVSPDKFFMMVEGGNIDWAAHANDGGAVIKEILNFNQSLQIAYDFYRQHPEETLIVVTADHDTGGMTTGVKNGPKKADFSPIDYQRISKEQFSNLCSDELKARKTVTWEDMKKRLSKYFGLYSAIKLNEKQDNTLHEAFILEYEKRAGTENKTLYSTFPGFVETVYNVLQHISGFGWTTNSHTGNPVPVFAVGEGAEEFSKMSNNTDIPHRIAKVAKIEEFDK